MDLAISTVRMNSIKVLLKAMADLVGNLIYLKGLEWERQQSRGKNSVNLRLQYRRGNIPNRYHKVE